MKKIKALKKLGFIALASRMEEAFIKELGQALTQYFQKLNSRNKVTIWPQQKKIKLDLASFDSTKYTYLIALVNSNFIIVNKEPNEAVLYKIPNDLDSKKLTRKIGNIVEEHYSDTKKNFFKKRVHSAF